VASRRRDYRGVLAVLISFCVLGAAALLPWMAQRHAAMTARQRAVVRATVLVQDPPLSLPAVALADSARPVDPGGVRAVLAVRDPASQVALVAAEDGRLRALLHGSSRLRRPSVVPVRGSTPTLVLPARRATYTAADLSAARALVELPSAGRRLLVDSVLVLRGATLKLGSDAVAELLLEGAAGRFTSLVAWGGRIQLIGSAKAPLTVRSWNRETGRPVADGSRGRPYIRAVGARLELDHVRTSELGFWSGRTGGVAWTGSSSVPSTGGAVASAFTANIYGGYVSRTEAVTFTDDVFQSNALDGLRIHRGARHTVASGSATARNGGNGFVVDRGASGTTLTRDLAMNNAGNGFLLDGRALSSGPSVSGMQAISASDTALSGSQAEVNGRTGVVVEGGRGTAVTGTSVCSATTAIAIRGAAAATVLNGNDISCGGRVGLSIGAGVSDVRVTANHIDHARIGVLIRGASGVRLTNNRLTDIAGLGIALRGLTPGLSGQSNHIAGQGVRTVDAASQSQAAALTDTDTAGWSRRSHTTLLSYLRYHPVLLIWFVALVVVAMASVRARLRRRPARLYPHSASVWNTHSWPGPSPVPVPAHRQQHPAAARNPEAGASV
jgi:hypothetical protein